MEQRTDLRQLRREIDRTWRQVDMGRGGVSEITLRHVTCAARWRRACEHSFPTPYAPCEGTLLELSHALAPMVMIGPLGRRNPWLV